MNGTGAPTAVDATGSGAQALLELLDRDGQTRQSLPVAAWPLRIGRALDNDVVLSDAHVAPHHITFAEDATGLTLTLGDTRNGVLLGPRRLRAGESAPVASDGEAIELTAGRTRMRLRFAGQALAPELPLAYHAPPARRVVSTLVAAFVLLCAVLFEAWLAADPDNLARVVASALLAAVFGAAVWCGLWALLSKTFTRQAHFGWHLRVFLFAVIALLAARTLSALLAFSLSWPWLSDFAFVGTIAVVACALYYHLLAVEPARHRPLKAVALTCALVGVALSMWLNLQRSDMLGDELYMNHLFPPAFRVARPVAADAFVDGLAPLKGTLERKATEPGRDDDAGRDHED